MPAIELGDRVKYEDFLKHAPGLQPGALLDLDVRWDASNGQFTATERARPGGSNQRVLAAQCVGRCGRLSCAARADTCAPIIGAVSPSIVCARYAVYVDLVTR